MSTLPMSAFPVGANASGSSTFVVAVLMGLALYLASKNTPIAMTAKR